MRVLFDQGTPVPIRKSLSRHIVRTAAEEGWSTLVNGDLLRAAERAGFDVLLTTDNGIPSQQNLSDHRIAVVIIRRNKWSLVRNVLPQIVAAVEAGRPGTCVVIDVPPDEF